MSSTKFRIIILKVIVLITIVEFAKGQNVLLPRPEVEDPFKDNPKWDEFKLIQGERVGRLKTLVNNVWNLVDNIAILGEQFSFKEYFIRFHFRVIQNFFVDARNRLHGGNPFSIINPAIGLRKIANLFHVANFNPSDPLNEFRTKWTEVDSLTLIIHQVFNKTAEQILQTAGGGGTDGEKLFDMSQAYPVNSSGGGDDNATTKSMTLDEIASKINDEMTSLGPDKHLLRGLVQILRNIKQSNVQTDAYMNFFCYGNNEFGIIPELLDLLSDAALHLIIADMEKLVLDVYSNALPILSNDPNAKIKDTLPHRNAIWDTMISRLNTKYNFTYLDGKGWGSSAAPAIFKCDLPPETSGQKGQWGRNLTTGSTPPASPNFVYDPQTGSYTSDGVVGYFDNRSPVMTSAIGFDNAFQGYLESELVLSQFTTTSCAGTCADFYSHPTKTCEGNDQRCDLLRSSHCAPGTRNCLEQSKCPSFAQKCTRAAQSVTICPSSDSGKRYDWLRLGEHVMKRNNVSDTSECSSGPTASATEKWEIENSLILSAPQYCELCLCVCMTPKSKEDQMYFDIQPSLADVAGGKIISAVRFIKEGNVIRLAVEHGIPLEKGSVDESTLSWVDPLSSDKEDANKTIPLGVDGFLKMNIDLIIGEVGTVLTGIRFRRIQNDTLGLEIQTTPISWPENDSKQITLKNEESTWKSADESTSREPVKFWKPGNPAFQLGPSMPDSVLNSFVEFTTTSFEQDLAQTVIPFFDTQSVHYYDGRHWLRGLGIIHKGKPGSGGFMAPLIVPARPYTTIRYLPVPPPQ